MNYYQIKILQDVYESVNGLQPFTFYSRYKLKPEIMFQHIDALVEQKLISIINNTIQINENGRRIVKSKKITKPIFNKYDNIPAEFIDEKLKLNSFYIPNISYISD